MTRAVPADYVGPLPPSISHRALALVALGATAISFAPILVKALIRADMAATPIAVWRVMLASAALIVFCMARRWLARLPRQLWLTLVVGGVFFAIDLWVWHRSIIYVGAGMATILGNTQVFWAALIGRVMYGERLGARFAVGAITAFTGVVMLAGVGSRVAWSRDYAIGIALGLATGLVYAVYILSVRHANRLWDQRAEPGAPGAAARASVVLGLVLAASALPLAGSAALEGELSVPRGGHQWAYLAALVLVVQIGGWLAISRGLPHVAAARGSLVLLLQAALAALWGALFFGESLEPLQLAGAALTLSGVYLGSTRKRSQEPSAGQPGKATTT